MEQKDYRLAAIMYTDIHQFSRMMEKDEAGTIKLLGYHNDLLTGVVNAHNGTVIKTIGDALLVDFKNTVDALQSALEIQDKIYAYNKEHPQLPLLLRIGLHLGDIYFYEHDALGDGINIAARLQSIAHPGCICMSADVYNLVLNKVDFEAEKLGRVSLKNITKEINVYEITTPNVEFDPEHDKPRPGYKPGSYAEGGAGGDASAGPKPEPAAKPSADAGSRGPEAEAEGKAAIKRSILGDVKAAGRRLSVSEIRSRYASYGPAAEEAIAELSAKGILVRDQATQDEGDAAAPASSQGEPGSYSERFRRIGERIVDEVAKSIETSMEQRNGASGRGPSRVPPYSGDYSGRRELRHQIRAEVRAARHGYPSVDENAPERKWEAKMEKGPFDAHGEYSAQRFETYRDEVEASARKTAASFIPSFVTWGAFTFFIFWLNARAPGMQVPWAVFPVAGWGIGVFQHLAALFRKRAKAAEVGAIMPLEGQDLLLYQRINRGRDNLIYHAASTVGTCAFFGAATYFLQTVTGAPFPWLWIPALIMIFSLVSHAAVSIGHLAGLKSKLLSSLGISGGWSGLFRPAGSSSPAAGAVPEAYRELFSEALEIRAGIVAQIKKDKKKAGPVGKEMIPALEEYVGQIRQLAVRTGEVDALVDAIPMDSLKSDKEALLRKEGECSNDRLKKEYRKSIGEIERQESSFGELENQREMLRLKLGSAVNSLKQMRIEVARLSTMPELEDDSALMSVKQKSSELSEYLDDLRTGFEEQARDPYAELAEAERKRLEAAPPQGENGAG